MGPKEPTSTVLTKAEEALIVAFRKHTLLPLDDCLYALQCPFPGGMPIAGQPRIYQKGRPSFPMDGLCRKTLRRQQAPERFIFGKRKRPAIWFETHSVSN